MSKSSTERARQRNTLLTNGYRPLPLADKGVFIQGWSRADITADWLAPFKRVARYANTGLRCDDLIAFDIDILDEPLADRAEALIEDTVGPTELCRVGQWPKRLLLYRLDGDMGRSGRTGNYGGHMVELLHGNGRQFAAFGRHPKTGKNYTWDGDSPLDVAWSDLPAVSVDDALALLDDLDAMLAATGLPQQRKAHTRGGSGQNEYDLMPDTEVLIQGERVRWADLVPTLTKDGVFGNLWRPEYEDFGDSDAVHFYLAKMSGEPCAHDFVHDTTHWESTWQPDFAALLPPPPRASGNVFVDPDMQDLIDNCVILRDKTVRRLDRPYRVYPLEGFVRSYQHLQVPDPNPPASNPNKQIPFTRLWERSRDTLKADYAALRPDFPADRIITRGSERVLNTYLPPAHSDTDGETDTFYEFIAHLVPDPVSADILLDWIAHKVVHPGDRMHGMLMVTPAFGTGRGTLVQIFHALFGSHYVNEVELSDLVGTGGQAQFNAYLADSLVVTISEALEEREDRSKWSSRHIAYERLKVVCDPVPGKMHIRRKYGQNSSERVFASLFISSNHTDALAIEPGDRRLIVLDNTETPLIAAPGGLYERIHAWKQVSANVGRLWLEMRDRALQERYDAFGEPPMTAAKKRMIDAGQSDTDRLFDLFVDQCAGDICTPAQWRRFAHGARLQYDLDLPMGDKLEAALTAVITKRARRCEGLTNGMVKVDGSPVRPWILRDFPRWSGSTQKNAIRSEIAKNGPAGSQLVKFPDKSITKANT